jgi:hypothetical protein
MSKAQPVVMNRQAMTQAVKKTLEIFDRIISLAWVLISLNLRHFFGMEIFQKFAGPLHIKLGVLSLDLQEEAILRGHFKAGHTKNRVVRLR